MQSLQESIKDATKVFNTWLNYRISKIFITENDLQICMIRSYCVYSTLIKAICSKQKKTLELKQNVTDALQKHSKQLNLIQVGSA